MGKEKKKGFNPKSQITGIVILIALVVFTFLIIRGNISEINWQGFKKAFHDFNPIFAIPAGICLLLYIGFEGRAMAAVSKPFGLTLNPIKSSIYACTELYFSGLTPSATGGQPAVVYYMNKDGYAPYKSTAMMIMNTTHYTIAMVVLGIFALVACPGIFFSPKESFGVSTVYFVPMMIVGIVLHSALLFGCLMLMFSQKLVRSICGSFFKLMNRMHIVKSYEERMEKLERSLSDYAVCTQTFRSHPLAQVKCLAYNILQRASVFAIPYFIYLGFGGNAGEFFSIFCIQIVSAITVSTLPLPGSVGVSELIFISLYSNFYAKDMIQYGMLFSRFFNFYFCMIICAAVSIGNHIRLTLLKR